MKDYNQSLREKMGADASLPPPDVPDECEEKGCHQGNDDVTDVLLAGVQRPTPPLTEEELAEWQEWSDRATPGPWNVETESDNDGDSFGQWHLYVRGVSGGDPKEWSWVVRFDDDYGTDQTADAHFIALCRSYVPRLIADLRAADTRADLLEDDRASWRAETLTLRAEVERLRAVLGNVMDLLHYATDPYKAPEQVDAALRLAKSQLTPITGDSEG